jgi:bacillolysin
VWGAQYLVHLRERDEGLEVGAVNGDYFTELDVPTEPAFDRDAAEEIARLRARPLVIDRVVHHGLTVLPHYDGILTYHLTLWGSELGRPARKEVFVNALTGSLALAYDGLVEIAQEGTGITSHRKEVPLQIFENDAGVFELRDQSHPMMVAHGGEITTHDVGDSETYFGTDANVVTSDDEHFDDEVDHSDSGAVDAHYGAGKFYEFFERLNRNSIDNRGKSIVSSVNATTENGRPLFNAFWDGSQVVYGNPDPDNLHPFSADLDIVGHELTHGVVQFTGNLALISQPGAANEAYADYFGNAIDIEDSGTPMNDLEAGFIGEDLCRDGSTSSWPCPLRDLNEVNTTDDYGYYLVDFDNGGVHDNATIYGSALWDIREALPDERADRYIYQALRDHTTPLSDFFDGRNEIIQAVEMDLEATPQEKDFDKAKINEIFDDHKIVRGWDRTVPRSDAQTLVRNASPLALLSALTPPAVSGSRFILGDYEKEEDLCCEPLQIFVGNVSRPVRLRRVGQGGKTLDNESPDISGRRAVWSHITEEQGGLDASVSTRVLGGRVRRVADARGFQWHPSVDGRLIAWEDSRDGDTDIWARRIGRRPRKVIDLRGEQLLPQVSGDWIAWWDVGSGFSQRIGMKNFATGRRITLRPPTRRTLMGPPTMGPRHVFWYQDPNATLPVALMKARIGRTNRTALIREGSPRAPRWQGLSLALIAANNSYVAYTDERRLGGRDVRLIPVDGGRPVRVTTNRGDQAYPGLGFGRRVVFLDASQGRTDLVARTVR